MSFRIASIALVFASAWFASARAESVRLTLEQALSATEEVNLSVLISRENVTQARAEADRERAALMPRLSLEAEQRRTQAVQISGKRLSVSPPTNRFEGLITGNLNLLNPAVIASYRAARQGIAIAETDQRDVLQSVMSAVAGTYFTHLRNINRIRVLDANIARARALLDLARRQLDAGVATQIDVTRAEAQVALTEQARLQQDTVVVDSELQLKRLLNLPPSRSLELQPFKVRRVAEAAAVGDGAPSIFARRADFVRAEQVRDQTEQALRAARLERVGSLNLFGEYGYAGVRAFDGRVENAWLGGVSLSVPVFDGGRISANQRLVQSALRAQEYQLRDLERAIGSELQLATQDARSRAMQITVAERSLALAEDELRLAQIRFERGAADNREIIEAQNRLAVASDNLVEATYQYHISRLELARARGEVRDILRERAE